MLSLPDDVFLAREVDSVRSFRCIPHPVMNHRLLEPDGTMEPKDSDAETEARRQGLTCPGSKSWRAAGSG